MTSTATDRRLGVNSGAAIKVPCKAATTANITLSGEQTVDAVSLVTGDRCLVKSQTTGADNGIYIVDSGTWTRAPDWDGSYDIKKGTFVYITNGTVNSGLFYSVTTSDPITIGSTSVAFGTVTPSSVLTLPLPLTQGGTAVNAASKNDVLSALGVVECTSVGGTGNAITCTIGANTTAYRTNQLFLLTPTANNSAATTLTPTTSGGSSLAAKNVFSKGAACVGGELLLGVPVLLLYDGTQLNVIGPLFKAPTMSVTGTTTLGGLLDISGASAGQIKFPATQNASSDANTLDDYEEGTWTPLTAGASSYTTQAGRYIKIGKLVYISARITVNASGGADGAISGAPFSPTAGNDYYSFAVGVLVNAATNFTCINGLMTTTSAIFMEGVAAAGTSMSNLAVLAAATTVGVSGCFVTTA